jgi:hypothetical protein
VQARPTLTDLQQCGLIHCLKLAAGSGRSFGRSRRGRAPIILLATIIVHRSRRRGMPSWAIFVIVLLLLLLLVLVLQVAQQLRLPPFVAEQNRW